VTRFLAARLLVAMMLWGALVAVAYLAGLA
jgi:hypothetical protein